MSTVATFPPTRLVQAANRSGRFYETPAGALPSVTTILGCIGKPALLNWYAKTEREMVIEAAANLYEDAPAAPKMSRPTYMTTLTARLGKEKAGKKELDKACEIGSACHALIEWNLRKEVGQVVGPEPKLAGPALWAFAAWERWRQSVNLEPLWIEQTVFSATHQYAGTIDLVAWLDLPPAGRTLAVLDWKTGKAIYPEARLQNVAYAWAYHEMGHADAPPVGVIVRLPKLEKDPEFETLTVAREEWSPNFHAFLAAKELWVWLQEQEQKRVTAR